MMRRLLLLFVLLILFTLLSSIHAQEIDNNRDMLAYVTDDYRLMLYDPVERTETQLLENVGGFTMGRDGRVAFRRSIENDPDIYIFDPAAPAIDPINITQNQVPNPSPRAWSPDGRYLLFRSYQEIDEQSLYVWDGDSIINVMPDDLDTAKDFYVEWSDEGRLAFTNGYTWSYEDTFSEVYVWDGTKTVNLSQNPQGADFTLGWSSDGQLMFRSIRNGEYGVYVWDGVSFNDGVPALNSFVRVAPELRTLEPKWTDDNFIAFLPAPIPPQTDMREIILWSLETQSVVNRLPVSNVDRISWLAEGGQFIFSSTLASGIPSVYLDIQNTEGDILFSVHTGAFSWSSSGFLAYCGIDGNISRILSIWDGQESWEVARVSYRPAQWQNGQDSFSCNNG